MARYSTPGVFIEEIPTTGPVAGVGTTTSAFIGSAASGPLNTPVKISNWTDFRNLFGDYIISPRRYLATAVRGFFANGGTSAYIVRVGTSASAFLDLLDTAGGKTLRVAALQDGTTGNGIKVSVVTTSKIVSAAKLVKNTTPVIPIASAAGSTVTLQNAADAPRFQPGDWVTINDATNERVQVLRVRGTTVFLQGALVGTYANNDVIRIADLLVGQRTLRVAAGTGLEAGSVFNLTNATLNEDHVVDAVVPFGDGSVAVTLSSGLKNGYTLRAADPDVTVSTYEFDLQVTFGTTSETFTKLSMDARHTHYVGNITSTLVRVTPPVLPDTPSTQVAPRNQPAAVSNPTNLAGGVNDDLNSVGLTQYQTALSALELVDDVSIVVAPDACVPGRTDTGVIQAAVRDHCEKMADRFAILDSILGATPALTLGSTLQTQRAAVESARGYAALYYPWITIADPSSTTDATLLVPPSGHVAGIFSRSDDQRGVHKAPANELITGSVGLERLIDSATQGDLNDNGINVLRSFAGGRPTVWGARTTVPPAQTTWRYVNVRRLFLFVEKSVQDGIRWAVFEPNDLTLWKKLSRTLTEFLTRVWRSGALFGATAAQAFYVKIDEENNPPALRALGQVIIEIGLAPVRPAEFVVVRIGVWAGGSSVTEQ